MATLSDVLKRCTSPEVVDAAAARSDILGDAALRLWSLCVPAITAADADACTQASLARTVAAPSGGEGDVSHGMLRTVLKPKTKMDGQKLVAALEMAGSGPKRIFDAGRSSSTSTNCDLQWQRGQKPPPRWHPSQMTWFQLPARSP